jgi:hypothetical protein
VYVDPGSEFPSLLIAIPQAIQAEIGYGPSPEKGKRNLGGRPSRAGFASYEPVIGARQRGQHTLSLVPEDFS